MYWDTVKINGEGPFKLIKKGDELFYARGGFIYPLLLSQFKFPYEPIERSHRAGNRACGYDQRVDRWSELYGFNSEEKIILISAHY